MAFASRKTFAISLTAIGVFAWAAFAWISSQRRPTEVRTLEAIVQRLGQSNDLGSQPLSFMVASGTTAAQLAQERGLCKPDECEFFAHLNPYQRYANGWDELVRQSYALGDIEGWSASSGTVVIPRAAFRAYGPRLGFLACTVAHEIAHVRRYHVFEQSYHLNHNLRGLTEEQQKRASLKRSREMELQADGDAATMLARAGYPNRVCEQELAFMARSTGDGSRTEPDSTHPGYEERLAAMQAHYNNLDKQPPKPQTSTRGSFRYDRADNLLTFTPLQSR